VDTTKRVGTCYAELVFFHPVQSAFNIVRSGMSRARNIDALFLMLNWAWCGSHKKRTSTGYTKLMFFHLVRFAGHIVHSGLETVTHYFSSSSGSSTDSKKSASGHIVTNLCFFIPSDLLVT
jgi:hypothetical protein